MARKFLTRETIDQLLGEGVKVHQLGAGDVVTDAARDHARARGLQLVPAGDEAPSAQPAATAGSGGDEGIARAKLRSAVISALGEVPDGLDAAIDKALGS